MLYVTEHYLGDGNSSNMLLKPLALARGWVYVASSKGYDYVSLYQNRWHEAKQRISQVVGVSKGLAHGQYGRNPEQPTSQGFRSVQPYEMND